MGQTQIQGNQVFDKTIDPQADLLLPTGSDSSDMYLNGSGSFEKIITYYSGSTLVKPNIQYDWRSTTTSGVATFNPTNSLGQPIFTKIDSIQFTAELNTSTATAVPLVSIKQFVSPFTVLTANVIVGQTLGLFGGNTVAFAPNGTVVRVTIKGS